MALPEMDSQEDDGSLLSRLRAKQRVTSGSSTSSSATRAGEQAHSGISKGSYSFDGGRQPPPTPSLPFAEGPLPEWLIRRALAKYTAHPEVATAISAAALMSTESRQGSRPQKPLDIIVTLSFDRNNADDVLSAFEVVSLRFAPFWEIEREFAWVQWDAPGGPYRDLSRQMLSSVALPSTMRLCGVFYYVGSGAEHLSNSFAWTGVAVPGPGSGFSMWTAPFGMSGVLKEYGGIEEMVRLALTKDEFKSNRSQRLKHNRETSKRSSCVNCLHPFPNEKLQKCSRCLEATYCSARCQRADWPFHKLSCVSMNDVNEHLEEIALSDRPKVRTFHSLRTFLKHIDPDLLSFLHAGFQLLTPNPLHTTHTAVLKVARTGSDDPSLAFSILSAEVVPHQQLDKIIPRDLRINGQRFSETVTQEGLRKHWGLGLLPQHLIGMAVVIDAGSQFAVGVPLSFSDVKMLRETSSERRRLSRCGARAVDLRWAERLKERARVSDTVYQEGVVPKMTKREHARWCEGVSLALLAEPV
ncbi:hypothetical protein BCR35DRAFT_330974 [Leucosporidium creatinivorum]|uniref:MYND-type domain-containing protein n=1 Tax=Leucosporidium creatinivorum TaxID=106004 RepID=A0A1Y2FMX7_9BASI|nr:hypothetical protein BCR35DRAFT_330974 [Leucosporidium creatinivorum]